MKTIKITLKRLLVLPFITLPVLSKAETLSPLTPQMAEYKVYYDNIELGKARYKLQGDNKHFTYTFESALALLVLSDNREVTSEFSVKNNIIQPLRYFHARKGTGHDYQEQLVFLGKQKKIYSRYKGKKKEFDYNQRFYDSLSVQMQLRLDVAAKKPQLKYELIKGNKKDDYAFKIDGKEQILVAGKTYQTIKLEVVRKSKKRQTYIWLAPEIAYLPVKLTHFKKGNKQLEILISSYSFTADNQHARLK